MVWIERMAHAFRGRVGGEAAVLLSRTAVIVAARVTGSVLTLVYTLLLVRVTTPDELGLAMTVMSASFLMSIIMSLNVESGSIRFLVKYLHGGEMAKAAGFVTICWQVVATVGPLLLLGFFGLKQLQGGMEGGATVWLIMLLVSPLMALTRIDARHANALDAVLQGTLPRQLVRPFLFTLAVGTAFLLDARLSATVVMVLFLCTTAPVTLIQFLLLRRHLAFATKVRRDISDWREWLSTGIMLAPMLIVNEFTRDVLITSAAFGLAAEAVALFGISLALLNLLNFAVSAVDMAFGARIARALVDRSAPRYQRLFAAGAALKGAAVIGGAVIVWFLRDPVLGLFGPHYLQARDAFFILLAAPIANALTGPTILVLNVLGHRRELLAACLVGLAVMVVATPLAGSLGGVNGAAIGAASGFVLLQILLYVSCRVSAGIDPSMFAVAANLLASRRDRAVPR